MENETGLAFNHVKSKDWYFVLDSEQEQDKAVLSIGSNLSEHVCLLDLLKNYPQNRSDICVISTTRLSIWYSKQKRMSG